jgi:Ca2+-binding RTX toxin-like protein
MCNSRLGVAVFADSRIAFGAFPSTATCAPSADGSSYTLSNLWPQTSTSFTTVKIDQEIRRLDQAQLLVPPTTEEVAGGVYSEYAIDDINITQVVQFAVNPMTGRTDAARISYAIENNGVTAHDVGIRWMLDANVSNDNTAPYLVGGSRVPGEADFVTNIPDGFEVENSTDPLRNAGGTLVGGGSTTPSRFVISTAANLTNNPWHFQAGSFTWPFDTASAAYWERLQLPPGGDVAFATQYGLGPAGGGGGGGDGEPFPGCTPTATTQCGSDGDDDLTASNGTVRGGPGDDTIHVIVDPDTGEVIAEGGDGNDTFLVTIEDPENDGPITLIGDGGHDTFNLPKNPGVLDVDMEGGPGNDTMRIYVPDSSARRSWLQAPRPTGRYTFGGGGGNDDVISGFGADVLSGDLGKDTIFGGGGGDGLRGGGGDDTLRGNGGANKLSGGKGTDLCISDNRRDRFSSCERTRRNH